MSFEGADVDNYGGDEDGHRKRDTSRKRDGKKDKKEKGYMMFEEEESDGESLVLAEDLKSPSKAKGGKAKPFKFPARKEKTKEKEEKKDKEAKKEEKEKRREEKEGKKLKKGKKNAKLHEPAVTIAVQEDNPIFGVPLSLAVERNKSHDGIELPAIVRECIDYIEECGLACEGIYRISGVKSKVQALKDNYNRHQPIYLYEHEPNIVASLLKQFLRDLPEPVLTTSMMPKFEEASTAKNNKKKVELFSKLIQELPACNRLLLSWMIVHMSHVIDLAKENKMTLQNVSIVLSPTMRISHRVLNVLFSNTQELFGDVQLRKYVPPLRPAHSKWSLELPDNQTSLEEELAKQESLLNQLHTDLNSGLNDPVIEDQLWEVQRVVTQLKRKIKLAKKNTEKKEGVNKPAVVESKRLSNTSLPSLSAPEELKLDLQPVPIPQVTATSPTSPTAPTAPGELNTDNQKEDTVTLESSKTVKFVEPPATVVASSNNKDKELTQADKDKKTNEAENLKEEDKKKVEENTGKEKHKDDDSIAEKQKNDEDREKNEKETKEKEGKQEVQVNEEENKDKANSTAEANDSAIANEKVVPSSSDNIKSESKSVEGQKDNLKNEQQDESQPVVKDEIQKGEQEIKEAHDEKADTGLKIKTEKIESKPSEEAEKQKETTGKTISSSTTSTPQEQKKKEIKREQEQNKQTPVPPFMSLTLLEPVKAEIPTKKRVGSESSVPEEEEWRELEEELLGQKKDKKKTKEQETVDKVEDDVSENLSIEQLLEEECALKLEEEELKAIADELRQKMATERSEMERLAQEIQELHYLRQDSDLEDMSSDSNSSDESEDEDDLQELLAQLIKDNQDLETQNAEMCQKIHEERMICLSVKLQIRHLQQRQLEASCG